MGRLFASSDGVAALEVLKVCLIAICLFAVLSKEGDCLCFT